MPDRGGMALARQDGSVHSVSTCAQAVAEAAHLVLKMCLFHFFIPNK
jgi:hypothetical protein